MFGVRAEVGRPGKESILRTTRVQLRRVPFLALLALGVFLANEAGATTYHVANSTCTHGSTACSDSNSGLSRSAPLCTIQAGINKLASGSSDTLLIHTGVYGGDSEFPNWSNTGGASPTSPITLQGASGDVPSGIILRGTASQSSDRSDPTVSNTAVLRVAGVASSQRIENIRIK